MENKNLVKWMRVFSDGTNKKRDSHKSHAKTRAHAGEKDNKWMRERLSGEKNGREKKDRKKRQTSTNDNNSLHGKFSIICESRAIVNRVKITISTRMCVLLFYYSENIHTLRIYLIITIILCVAFYFGFDKFLGTTE